MTKRETRALGKVEVRADEDGSVRKISGYAAVFNSPTEIGGYFREQIAPGAFKNAIGRDDVRALFNHDSNLVLGRTSNGTLKLEEDEHGLRYEITPPDTQWARDLLKSIERGDVNQSSFAFVPKKESWDETGDIPLRTLNEVELYDVSPVTYPAYADTEVGLRSLDAWRTTQESGAAAVGARLRMDLGLRARGISRL